MSYEEEVYTYSEVIAKIRDSLIDYFRDLANSLIEAGSYSRLEIELKSSKLSGEETKVFERVGVVDGGSNIISLNIGYIGVVASVGIVLEGNSVVERLVANPVIAPSDPGELDRYESINIIQGVVDKIREALVFETALKVLDKNIDLLVIDGPLVPYGALAKRTANTHSEEEAWQRYHRAVIDLHKATSDKEISVIGFVKRPRSRYIAMLNGLEGFDHVILSRTLEPGEYCPEPPLELYKLLSAFHDPEVTEIVKVVKPRAVYMKFTEASPPYRIDLGHLTKDHREVLAYLYSIRTREGIPFIIMKADEETKITRKLIKELYEDILHDYIVNYISSNPNLLIPLLPEYGGV